MSGTPCHLTILSELSAFHIAELTMALEPMEPDDPDVAEALRENSTIRFESIFEGDIPPYLMRMLCRGKISFVWEWEQFYGTGAGLQFYSAATDAMHFMKIHEEVAVMPVAQVQNPDKVESVSAAIREMNEYFTKFGLAPKPF